MMSISVIVMKKDHSESLMNGLSSLLQLPENIEVILLAKGIAANEKEKTFLKDHWNHHQIIETDGELTLGEACNLAISQARDSEWLMFLDDESSLENNYWEKARNYLKQKEIDVLGGPVIAHRDLNLASKAVKVALSSPFCTGLTFSRHFPLGKRIQFAGEENLFLSHLWIRKKFFKEVEFPKLLSSAGEALILAKFSQNKLGMYYHPKLKVLCSRESNLSRTLKEYFRHGYNRSLMMKEKVDFSWSYYLPSLFIVLHFSVFYDLMLFGELVKIYLFLIASISIGISQRHKILHGAPLVFFLHYFIVLVYGLGFMWARLHRFFK